MLWHLNWDLTYVISVIHVEFLHNSGGKIREDIEIEIKKIEETKWASGNKVCLIMLHDQIPKWTSIMKILIIWFLLLLWDLPFVQAPELLSSLFDLGTASLLLIMLLYFLLFIVLFLMVFYAIETFVFYIRNFYN